MHTHNLYLENPDIEIVLHQLMVDVIAIVVQHLRNKQPQMPREKGQPKRRRGCTVYLPPTIFVMTPWKRRFSAGHNTDTLFPTG